MPVREPAPSGAIARAKTYSGNSPINGRNASPPQAKSAPFTWPGPTYKLDLDMAIWAAFASARVAREQQPSASFGRAYPGTR
jgi:hypothetical protein